MEEKIFRHAIFLKAELFGAIGVAGDKVADRQYDVVLEVTSSWSEVMSCEMVIVVMVMLVISN